MARQTHAAPAAADDVDGRRTDEEAKRLQALLTSGQPAETGTYLFVPRAGVIYAAGSTVPALGSSHVSLPSGLLVPAGARLAPAPIDFIGEYITAEELFGYRAGFDVALRWISEMPRDAVLAAVAELLGTREADGANWTEQDRQLAANHFAEPARSKALNLLTGRRVLVSPQALLIAAKAALQLSRADADTDLRLFIPAVMGIQEDLGDFSDESQTPALPQGRLFREFVRSQAFHLRSDARSLMTSFQQRWFGLPPTMPEPRMDLVAEFEEAVGVPLSDLMTVGVALRARATQFPGQPFDRSWFSSLVWAPARLERVIGLLSLDAGALAVEVEKDERDLGFGWSFDTLRRWPMLRLEGDRFLVISPRLLMERTFGWLPVFDMVDAWGRKGEPERGKRARGFFRDVCEHQVLASLQAIAGGGPARRVYDEDDLRAAYGTKTRVADAVFDAGEALVVVEVSTRQLQRSVRGSDSEEDLKLDLARGVYEKVGQLDATITALRTGEADLTGIRSIPPRRCVPVLVVTEGFPVNPMTTAVIEREIAERGLLQQSNVSPIRIIDQEELDMIESLVEAGRASLLTILDAWSTSTLRAMELRSFLGSGPLEVGVPHRLEGALRAAWAPAFAALGGSSPDDAAA